MPDNEAPPAGAAATTSDAGTVPDGGSLGIDVPDRAHATWQQRVGAAILDNAVLAGIAWLAVGPGLTELSLTPGVGSPVDGPRLGNPMILVPVGALAVLLVLQGVTGWTPGKLVLGIRVVDERTSRPAGVWLTAGRWVLHLLDSILLIGYLRPLWHARRQTFADTIARTVVVPAVPELPRRPRTVLYSAAVATVVLGLGYGCVPINSSGGSSLTGAATCEVDGEGPALTAGEIRPGTSVQVYREQRMWTVRETTTVHPGATLTWQSEPSVRDVEYRVEVEAWPRSGDGATVSQGWDIGTGGPGTSSDDPEVEHTRTIAQDGDSHEVRVEMAEVDESGLAELGDDALVQVRLMADGDVVAECVGSASHDG